MRITENKTSFTSAIWPSKAEKLNVPTKLISSTNKRKTTSHFTGKLPDTNALSKKKEKKNPKHILNTSRVFV